MPVSQQDLNSVDENIAKLLGQTIQVKPKSSSNLMQFIGNIPDKLAGAIADKIPAQNKQAIGEGLMSYARAGSKELRSYIPKNSRINKLLPDQKTMDSYGKFNSKASRIGEAAGGLAAMGAEFVVLNMIPISKVPVLGTLLKGTKIPEAASLGSKITIGAGNYAKAITKTAIQGGILESAKAGLTPKERIKEFGKGAKEWGAFEAVASPITKGLGLAWGALVGKQAKDVIALKSTLKEATVPEIKAAIVNAPKESASILQNELNRKMNPVGRMIEEIKKARNVRNIQENLYSEGRSARLAKAQAIGETTSGLEGLKARRAAHAGAFPVAKFEPIASKFNQDEIDKMADTIKDSGILTGYDIDTAGKGFEKILYGTVPTRSELKLLGKVFGKDLISAVEAKKTFTEAAVDLGYDVANVPRAVMSSADLSAPLRQGAFFVGKPKQWIPAFRDMFGAFKSEKGLDRITKEITSHPNYELMQKSGLEITEIGGDLTKAEEAFQTGLAERIPVLGRVVRASNRAYVGFLNKLRADVFNDLVKTAKREGRDIVNDSTLTRKIADFVNVGTGRGKVSSVGIPEDAAQLLNAIFYSPKLMSSRIQLLSPKFYLNSDPFIRKQALKTLFSFMAVNSTILGLAKLGGAKISTNPVSSDFGKIRLGNTRIDPWGGLQQYAVGLSRIISGTYVGSQTHGNAKKKLGEGYKAMTRYDVLTRLGESKLAPVMSFVTTLLKGKNFAGQKVDITDEIASRFTPMIVSDMYDVWNENPKLIPAQIAKAFAVGIISGFGMGVQTYSRAGSLAPKKPTIYKRIGQLINTSAKKVLNNGK